MAELDYIPADAEAMWDANLTAVAEQYLADFDYPSDEARAKAINSLKAEIESAAEAWIEANCEF